MGLVLAGFHAVILSYRLARDLRSRSDRIPCTLRYLNYLGRPENSSRFVNSSCFVSEIRYLVLTMELSLPGTMASRKLRRCCRQTGWKRKGGPPIVFTMLRAAFRSFAEDLMLLNKTAAPWDICQASRKPDPQSSLASRSKIRGGEACCGPCQT